MRADSGFASEANWYRPVRLMTHFRCRRLRGETWFGCNASCQGPGRVGLRIFIHEAGRKRPESKNHEAHEEGLSRLISAGTETDH
jgi:hypothetical protein